MKTLESADFRDRHQFHIPVMGTGFTIDTPLRVGKFGISSVISIGDDDLIEQMRETCLTAANREYIPIGRDEPDARARRIQTYLNLVHDLLEDQIRVMRSASFDDDGDLIQYFELLPDCPLKQAYTRMRACDDSRTKEELQTFLRKQVVPGRIDVNIMTKINPIQQRGNESGGPESGTAMTALRGFATSKLASRVVLSAGVNKRLFAYIAKFSDFLPVNSAPPKKGIVLKVSDYRSALLQGKLLARHGLWVSEFRIESGLNCGGHAFATKGELMGPILEEFRSGRKVIEAQLKQERAKALTVLGLETSGCETIEVSAQGGVGTTREHAMLKKVYDADSVGWGTPFLLVPEATNIDAAHLKKLAEADSDDVTLSDSSPLGIPFWLLKTSASEEHRKLQISQGTPGSSCPKRYLISDTQFTETPICRASRQYQKLKLDEISRSSLSVDEKKAASKEVTDKICLCSDLAASAQMTHGVESNAHTAVCCGVNITSFDKVSSLKDMVDHIYGRISIIRSHDRPHMFVTELSLYYSFLVKQIAKRDLGLVSYPKNYFSDFCKNLLDGIAYYREKSGDLFEECLESSLAALSAFEQKLTCDGLDGGELQMCLSISHPG